MQSKGSSRSGLIVNIAIGAVAISVAVMLISIAVVQGYQQQITNKITGFSNHIQITRLDFNNSFETNPIYKDIKLEKKILQHPGVLFIQPFAIKAGIVKTESDFEGMILKGVDSTFNWQFIRQHLVQGKVLNDVDANQNGIIIPEVLANKLKLKLGDKMIIYFVQDNGSLPRARKFMIEGIFNTGFEDLDATYGLIGVSQIQRLNKWDSIQYSGYEIGLKNFDDLNIVADDILLEVPYQLQLKTVTELYPQLFDWLGLLDLNVLVIIVLMIIVACINMSTAILILIVERSNMVGMFKAMGSNNRFIRNIFINIAARLIGRGLFWGNAIGLLFCITQYSFGWIKLNQEAYFLSKVPILLNWYDVMWINAGAFLVCVIIMFIPATFVSRITPIKAIRFE